MLQQNGKVVPVPTHPGNENIKSNEGKAAYILNFSTKWLCCVVSFMFRMTYLWGRQILTRRGVNQSCASPALIPFLSDQQKNPLSHFATSLVFEKPTIVVHLWCKHYGKEKNPCFCQELKHCHLPTLAITD
jgi:hypothetical protein